MMASLSLFAVSCQEQNWGDNANPEVFIPRHGITNATVWDVTSGTFDTYLGVYCGGVRPENQQNTIDVTYAVDNSIVDVYNADITQQYSGSVVVLPADCYTLSSSTVTIPAGSVDTQIPIKFNVAAVKAALEANPGKKVVIPIKLTGTSLYNISADKAYAECMMDINVSEPNFYFFCNNYGIITQAAKLIYGSKDNNYKFDVMANGVPDGNYTINFKIDQDALDAFYPGNEIIPADAVVLNPQSTYKDKVNHAMLEFQLIPEKLEFFKTYYLPVTMTCSEYAGEETVGNFFMTVEMKNEFEKGYSSNLSVYSEATDRTRAYSAKKNAVTYASDIFEINIATNNTIAGAKPTSTTATTYNNRYIRIKVIPTADKSHYDIEYIPVTDKSNKKQNTMDFFEAVPDAENYYDWNLEKFVLNYRWKHIEKKDTSWVVVNEVLQAN